MNPLPCSNLGPKKEETPSIHISAGRDIYSTGDIGPGSALGNGRVYAQNIAEGDIVTQGSSDQDPREEFTTNIDALKTLVIQAYRAGELSEKMARKIVANLTESADLAKNNGKPHKAEILRKLMYVADILDAAIDFLSSTKRGVKILIGAAPIATLLVKIATQIF
nr:hypothetical protein [Anaerolineae bacterium]